MRLAQEPGTEADNRIRVVGVGRLGAPVPGRQTVPRAELTACTAALEELAACNEIVRPVTTYAARALGTVDGAAKDKLLGGNNADCWERYGEAAVRVDATAVRTPAHTALDDLVEGNLLGWPASWATPWQARRPARRP